MRGKNSDAPSVEWFGVDLVREPVALDPQRAGAVVAPERVFEELAQREHARFLMQRPDDEDDDGWPAEALMSGEISALPT